MSLKVTAEIHKIVPSKHTYAQKELKIIRIQWRSRYKHSSFLSKC